MRIEGIMINEEERFELGDTIKVSLSKTKNHFDAIIRYDNWIYIYLGKNYIDKLGAYGVVNVDGLNFIKKVRTANLKESRVILIEKDYKYYGSNCACLRLGDGYFDKKRYK